MIGLSAEAAPNHIGASAFACQGGREAMMRHRQVNKPREILQIEKNQLSLAQQARAALADDQPALLWAIQGRYWKCQRTRLQGGFGSSRNAPRHDLVEYFYKRRRNARRDLGRSAKASSAMPGRPPQTKEAAYCDALPTLSRCRQGRLEK